MCRDDEGGGEEELLFSYRLVLATGCCRDGGGGTGSSSSEDMVRSIGSGGGDFGGAGIASIEGSLGIRLDRADAELE